MAVNKYLVERYNYLFFHTADLECAAEFGASGNSIMVFRNYDESPVHYSGGSIYVNREANLKTLLEFTKTSATPKLIKFGKDYVEHIFGESADAIILFTEEEGEPY